MRTLFVTVLIVLHAVACAAQPATVTVEGVGFVDGGDTATARDRAIADAQIRAVEQAFGVVVDARTALHKSLLIDDTMTTRTRGMVSSYRILHEQLAAGNLYRVKLEAVVDHEVMRQQLLAAAGARRVLLAYPAGQTEMRYPLLGQLAQMFATAGFQLSQMAIEPADFEILGESGVQHLAGTTRSDMVVAHTLDTDAPHCPVRNYCAALARGRVRLYDGKKGELIAAADTGEDPPRGFGHDAESARTDALNKGAASLIHTLTETLFEPPERMFTVAVLDLPDLDSYRQLKVRMEALRWVKAVTADSVGYHPVKSVFHVRFAQRPELFAGMLDKLGGYRLIGQSRQTFTLTVKETQG